MVPARRPRTCLTLVGPAIVPCECRLNMAECTVLDAGSYRTLFVDDGTGAPPQTLQNLTVTGGEALVLPPHLPCRRSGVPARWVRRDAACGGGAQQHPLCAVPAAAGGWQLVPHTCYYRAWTGAELSAELSNASLLFVGDSTQRFLWGAFGNLLEPHTRWRFRQDGYGAQESPRLDRGNFTACDRFRINVLRPLGGSTMAYTQLISAGSTMQPGMRYDRATDTFHVNKKGSICKVRVRDAWEALEEYLRPNRIDLILLQIPTLAAACNAPHGALEPEVLQLFERTRAWQPNTSLLRRSGSGWAASSVQSSHCLHRERIEQLESALRVAPRPEAFGASEEEWRGLLHRPFEMYRDTMAIHLVEPSDGVHCAPSVNVVFAHVLATHLLGVLRRATVPLMMRPNT